MRYLILTVLFLTGCATTPEPEIRTVRVEVPIEGEEDQFELVALFSEISVGDAP